MRLAGSPDVVVAQLFGHLTVQLANWSPDDSRVLGAVAAQLADSDTPSLRDAASRVLVSLVRANAVSQTQLAGLLEHPSPKFAIQKHELTHAREITTDA